MKIKNNQVDPNANIERSKLDWEENWHFEDDFNYPTTADLVVAGTPWRDASGGGATVTIPNTRLRFGQVQLLNAGVGNNAILRWKAAVAAHNVIDISQGVVFRLRFRVDSLVTPIYQAGLYVDGNNYAVMQYDPAVSASLQFRSAAAGVAAVSTSTVAPIVGSFYTLKLSVAAGRLQVAPVISSREAGLQGVEVSLATTGQHLMANVDTYEPYLFVGASAAVTPSMFVDKISLDIPRY